MGKKSKSKGKKAKQQQAAGSRGNNTSCVASPHANNRAGAAASTTVQSSIDDARQAAFARSLLESGHLPLSLQNDSLSSHGIGRSSASCSQLAAGGRMLDDNTGSRTRYAASLRFLSPILESDELIRSAQSLVKTMNDPSIKVDDSLGFIRSKSANNTGTSAEAHPSIWRVYVRRAALFIDPPPPLNCPNTRAYGMRPKIRPWWVVFVSTCPNADVHVGESGSDVDLQVNWIRAIPIIDEVAVHARKSMRGIREATDHLLTPQMVFAALQKTVEDVGAKPGGLLLWPGLNGTFRPDSMKRLAIQLRLAIQTQQNGGNMTLQIDTMDVQDMKRSENGTTLSHGIDRVQFSSSSKTNPETRFYVEPGGVVETIERRLKAAAEEKLRDALVGDDVDDKEEGVNSQQQRAIKKEEEEINERDFDRSALISCITETMIPAGSISIWELRTLYYAATRFHEECTWDKLTEWEYIVVRVPDLFVPEHADINGKESSASATAPVIDLASSEQRTYVITATGDIRWSERGLRYYYSQEEMRRHITGSKVRHTRLRYFERTSILFRTLDHIAELNLPIASANVPRICPEEGYPSYFQNMLPIHASSNRGTPAHFKQLWGRGPPRQDLVSIALATLAVVKFGADPVNNQNGKKFNPMEPTRANVTLDDVEEMESKTARVVAFPVKEYDMPQRCTWCSKHVEKVEAERGKMVVCGTCNSVGYCSKECFSSDSSRHKMQCARKV